MTVQNYGIHRLFLQSDQRRWVHTCPHCGYTQILDYTKNIKQVNADGIDSDARVVQPGTFQFVCQKCGKPLDKHLSFLVEILIIYKNEMVRCTMGYYTPR